MNGPGHSTLMLLALFIGAAVTVVGVRFVVNEMEATATGCRPSTARRELAAALETHEQLGHQLRHGGTGEPGGICPGTKGYRGALRAAAAVHAADEGRQRRCPRRSRTGRPAWRDGGLWGAEVLDTHGKQRG